MKWFWEVSSWCPPLLQAWNFCSSSYWEKSSQSLLEFVILKCKVNQCSEMEQKVSGLQEIDWRIRNGLWNEILLQKCIIVEIYVYGRDSPVIAELFVFGYRDIWDIIARLRTFRLSRLGWKVNMNGFPFKGYSSNVFLASDSDGRSQASSRCWIKIWLSKWEN